MISHPNKHCPVRNPHSGFTLVELLMVISIIAILASLAVSVLRSAEDDARDARTETVIGNIRSVIQRRFEDYETQTLPFRVSDINWAERGELRKQILAEWIRGELPTSRAESNTDPAQLLSRTSKLPSMMRRLRRNLEEQPATPAWSEANESAECLYAILKNSFDGENRGTHFLAPSEIGDTDGDQRLEVLDGWGDPVLFSITANGAPVDPANAGTLNDYVFDIRSSNQQ